MKASHLVIVPCHAIYTGGDVLDPKSWLGLLYGVLQEVERYVEHMEAGIRALESNAAARLIFSGGATRPESHCSEALGYLNAMNQLDIASDQQTDRIYLEDRARDSFENLLFSVIRFNAISGSFPKSVTVLGLGMKEERFLFHAKTIMASDLGVPPFSFCYHGVNDPSDKAAFLGEFATFEEFLKCPLGNGGVLGNKRILRNPHRYL